MTSDLCDTCVCECCESEFDNTYLEKQFSERDQLRAELAINPKCTAGLHVMAHAEKTDPEGRCLICAENEQLQSRLSHVVSDAEEIYDALWGGGVRPDVSGQEAVRMLRAENEQLRERVASVEATTPSGLPHDKNGNPVSESTEPSLLVHAVHAYQNTAKYWCNKHDALEERVAELEGILDDAVCPICSEDVTESGGRHSVYHLECEQESGREHREQLERAREALEIIQTAVKVAKEHGLVSMDVAAMEKILNKAIGSASRSKCDTEEV